MNLHVALLGMTGSGKTTIGRAVAIALRRPLLDSDELIATKLGCTGAEIAASDGTTKLHLVEQQITEAMLTGEDPAVLGVAASAVDDAATRDLLRTHAVCFWLDADVAILARRTAAGSHRRALEASELRRLRRRRTPHFAELAHAKFDTGASPPDEIAAHILAAVSQLQGSS
jgi:shikimate kinase